MDGIKKLNKTIKDIVTQNPKFFQDVNKKVPQFWIDVEDFACNKLSQMPIVKYVDDKIKIINNNNTNNGQQINMSMLCIDYQEYKEKIVEKYGMRHLVDHITKYMNSSGRVIWFHDSEKLRKKIFLRPSIFFEMFFVLYRSNFDENFNDVHVQSLRAKLVKNTFNTSDDNVRKMKDDLLKKGQLNMDLIKLLWFPILMSDSEQLIHQIIVLFMDFFHIGYPLLPKEKLKNLFQSFAFNSNEGQQFFSNSSYESSSMVWNTNNNKNGLLPLQHFTFVVIPFYLPMLDDDEVTKRNYRANLTNECLSAISYALNLRIKKQKPNLLPKIVLKYSFPWGLIQGVFEKFSCNCIINSDLYYKVHYRNFIYAQNEENTIAVLIYTNSSKKNEKSDQVVFEFYLISYELIIEGIQKGNKSRDEAFEHTLEMDLDQIWLLATKILQIFEETVSTSYPSLRYDRWAMCPECEKFTFYGEWTTPKELQKLKTKMCSGCEKIIESFFLVRPSSGKTLTLDLQKMNQRLENLALAFAKQRSMNTSHPKTESKSSLIKH